ncbi:unnamed protein product [Mytilus coruscus]|uniref:Uncharacterized protein n=1 Tax=Mytilus coruscus TaxID=42192 RepID=A0A6J8BCE1_MYTCO|nr:unnamed protein product [Mytilus coruscus]
MKKEDGRKSEEEQRKVCGKESDKCRDAGVNGSSPPDDTSQESKPVYIDMSSINLTPDEELLFLGRSLQTGIPVDLMSLLDRPGLNQTVSSPPNTATMSAPQIQPITVTVQAPVKLSAVVQPEVILQPAVELPMTQTDQPVPVTITPSSVVQSFLTGTLQPAVEQSMTQEAQPMPVTITLNFVVQPF